MYSQKKQRGGHEIMIINESLCTEKAHRNNQ